MKISVIGSGYVGLVTGACLADCGNSVICVDIDQQKIDLLNAGDIPIHEPGLEELIKKNVAKVRLESNKSHKNKLLQCQSATLERSGVLVKSKLLGFEIAL